MDERFGHYQNALTDIVEKASQEAVEYAESFGNPVVVMEDLSYIRENLDYGKYMNRRLHAWAFARLQGRIEDKATEAGIPVRFVNPRYTSQTCHACEHIGRRGSQAEFKCTNDGCHVTEFHAEINAAANIAGRVDPWGESVPWETEHGVEKNRRFFDHWKSSISKNPSRNGSASDSATVHRETSEKSSQMTLAAYSD